MKTSLIIPAYKANPWLEHLFKSIRKQTVYPDEILLGIDGCRRTREVFRKAIPDGLEGLCRVFWFPSNQGVYKVRNTLAGLSTGSILLFFDADDIMRPEYVETMLNSVRDDNLVRARGRVVSASGNRLTREVKGKAQISIYKKTFLDLKGFFTLRCGADHEFIHRAKRKGYANVCTKEVIWHYRKHPGSLTCSSETGMGSIYRRNIHRKIDNMKAQEKEPRSLETAGEYEEVAYQ